MSIQKEKWFESIIEDDNEFKQPISLKYLLEDSLYYPCPGYDSTPIDEFAGNIFSFIYVDILTKKKDHLDWIDSELRNNPFDHLNNPNASLVKKRKLEWNEIVPENWRPSIIPTNRDFHLDLLKTWEKDAAKFSYAYWSIWRIKDNKVKAGNNLRYFSLIYFGGCEMNATYQALYNRLNINPKILTIINPGMGFFDEINIGGVYKSHPFFKKVLEANSKGYPPFLFCDYNSYVDLSFIDLYDTDPKDHESFSHYYYFKLKGI